MRIIITLIFLAITAGNHPRKGSLSDTVISRVLPRENEGFFKIFKKLTGTDKYKERVG